MFCRSLFVFSGVRVTWSLVLYVMFCWSLFVFSGVRVTWSLVLCLMFCRSLFVFSPFSCGHFVVCSSSIYGFWITPLVSSSSSKTDYRKSSPLIDSKCCSMIINRCWLNRYQNNLHILYGSKKNVCSFAYHPISLPWLYCRSAIIIYNLK